MQPEDRAASYGTRVSGHVHQLSIYELVVMGEGVWQTLKLLDRNAVHDRHTIIIRPGGPSLPQTAIAARQSS